MKIFYAFSLCFILRAHGKRPVIPCHNLRNATSLGVGVENVTDEGADAMAVVLMAEVTVV